MPDFLYLGANRCGSTWIYNALATHPAVYVPPIKDIWYFDRFYDRGPAWYGQHFKHAPPGTKRIGEINGNYLYSLDAASRISRDLPDAQLFICVRDPIDRAISSFRQMFRSGQWSGTFEEAVQQDPSIIERGRYMNHVHRFEDEVGAGSIKIFLFDDLRRDGRAFARSLYRFLNVPEVAYEDADKRVNEASLPRSAGVVRWARGLSLAGRRVGLSGAVGKLKHSKLVRRTLFKPAEEPIEPVIPPATMRELQEYFQEGVDELAHRLDRDLSHWLAPTANPRRSK